MQYRSSQQRCSVRKGVVRNFTKFTGKHLFSKSNFSPRHFVFRGIYIKWRDLFRKTQTQPPKVFCKKGVLRNFAKFTGKQVFSCEFCETSKNTFFTEPLWWLLLSFPEKISPIYINSTKNKMSR